jgi:peptidase E
MRGKIVLVGGEEFGQSFDEVHAQIFSLLKLRAPKIVFFPTAAAKDGPGVAEHWAGLAQERLSSIGARVSPLMILDKKSANDANFISEICTADIIYLGGGLPQVYIEILKDSKAWNAVKAAFSRGVPIIGASAGAMILGEICLVNEHEDDYPPSKWSQGLNLLPQYGIGPHFNLFTAAWIEKVVRTLPKGKTFIGIDESTALYIEDGAEIILGKGKVVKYSKDIHPSYATVPLIY